MGINASSHFRLYGYLNLESTKTHFSPINPISLLYGYLNLESTKTLILACLTSSMLYGYLNLESTKTNKKAYFTR